MKSKFMLAGAAALATASVLSMTAQSAQADPLDGNGQPEFRMYQAVGSDTIQDVWNGLTNGASPVIPDVASYDAFGSPCITTHSGGTSWVRPAGSGNGAKFLSAANGHGTWAECDPSDPPVNPTTDDIAFSRSSSAPSVAGDDLTYIPFARDAVSVAVNKAEEEDATPDFTATELEAIYGGPEAALDAHVTWDDDTDPTKVYVDDVEVHPYLPQSGSGTRQFFLGAIGLSNDTDFPSYVDTQESYAENNGDVIDDEANALVPFSAAQWIAQKNSATTGIANTITATEDLATIGGTDPLNRSGSTPAPGALYGTKNPITGLYGQLSASGFGQFARDTYNVVPSDVYTGGANEDSTLVAHLTTDLSSTAARTVIGQFGFGNLATRTIKLGGWVS